MPHPTNGGISVAGLGRFELSLLIGLIWFGILNIRQPVLRQWQWLPLATGRMGFTGFFLFSGGAPP